MPIPITRARTLTLVAITMTLSPLLASAEAATPAIQKVGAITWHAAKYASKFITVSGYVLAKDADYVLFSDEPTGKISSHDLPVTGPGVEQLQLTKKYVLTGQFVAGGLHASNGSAYHLELAATPQALDH